MSGGRIENERRKRRDKSRSGGRGEEGSGAIERSDATSRYSMLMSFNLDDKLKQMNVSLNGIYRRTHLKSNGQGKKKNVTFQLS